MSTGRLRLRLGTVGLRRRQLRQHVLREVVDEAGLAAIDVVQVQALEAERAATAAAKSLGRVPLLIPLDPGAETAGNLGRIRPARRPANQKM